MAPSSTPSKAIAGFGPRETWAEQFRRATERLREADVEAFAVCFLFSFLDGDHEERTARIFAEVNPHWRISLSSCVLPTIRENPRLSTTVIDPHIGPIMESYLLRIAERLADAGITTPQLFLMQSNRGLMRINLGARFPNQTLLSGLPAGVVSGVELAKLAGREHVVTFGAGGGYGDLFARPIDLVLRDVRDGYVLPAAALNAASVGRFGEAL